MTESEFAELAAGHALHALSDQDERAFERALADHPEWTHHVAGAVDAAAGLADATEPVEPPATARAALLARISSGALPEQPQPEQPQPEQPQSAAGPAPATPSTPRRPTARWFALAASAVLVLALGIGAVVAVGQLTRPAAEVALAQIEGSSDAASATTELTPAGRATVHWSASEGQAVLVTEGVDAPSVGQTYELWFVRPDGAVSAGTFDVGPDGTTTTLLNGDYEAGDVIAMTVEPAGGSPTGEPTTDPLFAVET
ncbi:anti-sigma factor [Microbacterium hominis]|uniref:Regulator of SigK n=1 Tax=Microbacterium hominis TaxID=162426 RepID=A0A7D4QH80_9MICO|nr:anti-sigma factor [Microbacterium hominis]QKJ18736.1 anti-sigma factor [Microbacterium hominis]